MPLTALANTTSNFEARKKVIGLSGIMSVSGDLTRKVTRAQFARMLVLASAYRSVLTDQSNVSVFNDVKQGNEYASAIRLAAESGWMTGYLGGNFQPDQYVTLNEAAKGVLYLLGYAATDFTGDQYNKRMSQYAFLNLNDNISYTDPATVMTMADCVNLFYNLLCCDKKDTTTAYATVLGATVNSDGEVNALAMADNSLKGPKVVRNASQLIAAIPFSLDDASLFLDGSAVDRAKMEGLTYMVIYYSSTTKTVWAYSASDNSDADKKVISGIITSIGYTSTSTLTPSYVILDDDETDKKFYLSSTDMQFAFSIYGGMTVGSDVTLIYSTATSTSTDGDTTTTRTVIDYVEE